MANTLLQTSDDVIARQLWLPVEDNDSPLENVVVGRVTQLDDYQGSRRLLFYPGGFDAATVAANTKNAVYFLSPSRRETNPTSTWEFEFQALWVRGYVREEVRVCHVCGHVKFILVVRRQANDFLVRFLYEDFDGKQYDLYDKGVAYEWQAGGGGGQILSVDGVTERWFGSMRYVSSMENFKIRWGAYSPSGAYTATPYHRATIIDMSDNNVIFDVKFDTFSSTAVARPIGHMMEYHVVNYSAAGGAIGNQNPNNVLAYLATSLFKRSYYDIVDNLVVNGTLTYSFPTATTSTSGVVKIANDLTDTSNDAVPTAIVVKTALDGVTTNVVTTNHNGDVNITGNVTVSGNITGTFPPATVTTPGVVRLADSYDATSTSTATTSSATRALYDLVMSRTASQWITGGNNIYYNATGGYVGIGTIAPTSALHVVGNSVVSGQMGIGTDPIGTYKMTVNGTLCTGAPSGVFLWCGTGTNLANRVFALTRTNNNVQADLFTNNQDFYFATIRNFGLGTSAPAYKLDVSGTINATEYRLNGALFTGGASQWTTSGNNISFTSGNVGIANGSPQYTLDVTGAVNCSNLYVNASSSGSMLIPDAALTVEPASYQRGGITYKFDAANDAGQWGDKTWLYDNVTNGGLTFAAYNSDGNYSTTGSNSYTTNGVTGAYFGIKSDSASFVITGYRITSYTSPFTVNMKRLVTMGTNDVVSGTPVWTIVDDYTLTAAETASQTFDRTFANTSSYKTYRVVINKTGSGNAVIAEIKWRIPSSGARSLTVANGGNVGVNTSTPTYSLDVNGTINCTEFRVNGSVFSGASKWTTNGTNIYFNTGNVGVGTTSPSHKLDVSGTVNATEFRLNGNLFTGSSQWITSGSTIYYNSGNVGIGIANPTKKLQVEGSFQCSGLVAPFQYFVQRASGSTVLNWGGVDIPIEYFSGGVYVADRLIMGGTQQGFVFADSTTGHMHVMVNTNATQASSAVARKIVLGSSVNEFASFSADRVYMYSPVVVSYSVTATAFTNSSDARLKQNIQAINGDEIIEALSFIKGYRYQFRSIPDRTRMGLIAQEVAEVFPEAVSKGDDDMLQLEYSALIPILVEAIKHLSHRIDMLEGTKRMRI